MGWFSSRKGRRKESAGKIYEGPHRSPGFEEICHFLETEPAYSVLDLGASSTESVEFISDLCDDLIVQDVFHSTRAASGVRSEIFRFESAKDVSLPNPEQKFDVVLMWDILHYLAPEDRGPFIERLALNCAPNAMVLLSASSIAEIPPEPIHFKVLRRDRLEYVLSDDRAPSPGLTTREVEKVMKAFEPVRIFQLRNGLQEMVFQIPNPPQEAKKKAPAKAPAPKAQAKTGTSAKPTAKATTAKPADSKAAAPKAAAPKPAAPKPSASKPATPKDDAESSKAKSEKKPDAEKKSADKPEVSKATESASKTEAKVESPKEEPKDEKPTRRRSRSRSSRRRSR